MNIKLIITVLALVISNASSAVSVCKNCTITGIQPDVRKGGTFIWMDGSGDWSGSETDCSTPGTKAFFIPIGSALENILISVSMATFISKGTVGYAYGDGICHNGYETLNYIYVK